MSRPLSTDGISAKRGHMPRFVILGAGMSGILAAIKVREAGLHDFSIYEIADRLGGTLRAARTSRTASPIRSCARSCARTTAPRASA